MTRKEIYAQIKKLNLEEAVKTACGKNYTQVSNTELVGFIAEAKMLNDNKKAKCKDTCSKKPLEKVVVDLIKVLQKKHVLLDFEVQAILS